MSESKSPQILNRNTTITQRQDATYRSYFDFSSEAIFIHKDGIITDVNRTATSMLGYRREELLNKNILDIILLEKHAPAIIDQLNNTSTASYTLDAVCKNGQTKRVEFRENQIENEATKITSLRDVSSEIHPQHVRSSEVNKTSITKDANTKLEQKFETLFNISSNAYIIHNGPVVQEVNDMFTELYGYTKEEAKGIDIYDTLFPNLQLAKDYQFNCCKSRRTHFVGQQVRKDGSVFEAEIIASLMTLNDVDVRLVNVKDVSKLVDSERSLKEKNDELVKRNQELEIVSQEVVSSRNTFYQTIHTSHSNISKQDLQQVTIFGRWHYDFKDDCFSWTEEVKEVLGYGAGNISTIKDFIKHVHTDDQSELAYAFKQALENKNLFKFEFRFKSKDGKEKYVLAQGVAEYNEDESAKDFIGTLIDITDRKEIENRLKRQKDNYLNLNEELIISRKKAEDSEKLKTSFFSNMSHEIRTPMNGILGFSSLLMEPELSDEERLEYSQVIVDSGKRLLHIVNDVLDISKLESDTFKIIKSETKVNRLLDNLHSLLGQEKKIQDGLVKFNLQKPLSDDLCILNTDNNRLGQIITNLLSNSLKFTEEGSINFGYCVEEKALTFYVEDTGIGVPDDMKEKIFEPFRQVEGHLVREHGGTGLGLSISRKLTELLGGKMTLISQEGKGSRFSFSLPYEKPKVAPKPVVKAPRKATKVNIQDICLLIAEDDEINFLFFKSFLGNRLHLLRAKNGQEAVDMVKSNPDIDAILMDIKMPIKCGTEAIQEIKTFMPHLPIIAQTAYAMPEDVKQAYDAGADDYISKPINRRHLLEKISKLCIVK